jgi:hypothetical protein
MDPWWAWHRPRKYQVWGEVGSAPTASVRSSVALAWGSGVKRLTSGAVWYSHPAEKQVGQMIKRDRSSCDINLERIGSSEMS